MRSTYKSWSEPSEALELVLKAVKTLSPITVARDRALGYVLSEPLISDQDIPAFDNSAMDGFAVRSGDTASASPDSPVRLSLLPNTIFPGQRPAFRVPSGCGARIMTGAPMPEGADCVVPVELTRADGPCIFVERPLKAYENVRRAGEDIAKGDLVLPAGKVLTQYDIGLLSSLGLSKVRVVRRPSVGILVTGDEVVLEGFSLDAEVLNAPKAGKIRDSNCAMLRAFLQSDGVEDIHVAHAGDELRSTKELLARFSRFCDLLISTGGVSVGDKDLVKEAATGAGFELVFWKVAQKPGMPLAFWTNGQTVLFGLPGNPVAVAICYLFYVRPCLYRMMGRAYRGLPVREVRLKASVSNRSDRQMFYRCKLSRDGDQIWAEGLPNQGSGVLTSMAHADAIVILPPRSSYEKGARLRAILLNEIEFLERFLLTQYEP